ncbi:hypothetical protein EV421DRAFT_1838930 [Armillaria borealis]|uniref:DUF6534 domain-containing protein n=1 Tax=Armillaria borealis TaxID=47425 RepID=A0AA39MI64_9AGAR|nr:hypothetical protein EV421DRAFT_1838930 [Armillaria borealis]
MSSLGNIDTTLGIALVARCLASILYGVALAQAYYYFTNLQDPIITQGVVIATILVESAHQIIICLSGYHYLIESFNSHTNLDIVVWSVIAEVPLNICACLLVEGYFSLRIWRLTEKNIQAITPLIILMASQLALTIAFVYQGSQLSTFTDLAKLNDLSIAVDVVTLTINITIATIVSVLLWQSKKGVAYMTDTLTQLIIFAIGTSVMTSLCVVASLITVIVLPEGSAHRATLFCMGRLYHNALLFNLNTRSRNCKASPGCLE